MLFVVFTLTLKQRVVGYKGSELMVLLHPILFSQGAGRVLSLAFLLIDGELGPEETEHPKTHSKWEDLEQNGLIVLVTDPGTPSPSPIPHHHPQGIQRRSSGRCGREITAS